MGGAFLLSVVHPAATVRWKRIQMSSFGCAALTVGDFLTFNSRNAPPLQPGGSFINRSCCCVVPTEGSAIVVNLIRCASATGRDFQSSSFGVTLAMVAAVGAVVIYPTCPISSAGRVATRIVVFPNPPAWQRSIFFILVLIAMRMDGGDASDNASGVAINSSP